MGYGWSMAGGQLEGGWTMVGGRPERLSLTRGRETSRKSPKSPILPVLGTKSASSPLLMCISSYILYSLSNFARQSLGQPLEQSLHVRSHRHLHPHLLHGSPPDQGPENGCRPANTAPILKMPLTRATFTPSAVTRPCMKIMLRVTRMTCASPCTHAPSGACAR